MTSSSGKGKSELKKHLRPSFMNIQWTEMSSKHIRVTIYLDSIMNYYLCNVIHINTFTVPDNVKIWDSKIA